MENQIDRQFLIWVIKEIIESSVRTISWDAQTEKSNE